MKKMCSVVVGVLFLVVTSAVRTPALENAYFVSPTGSDNNPGTESQPYQTFNKVMTVAQCGDTVNILAGTYTQNLVIDKLCTSSLPLKVTGMSVTKPVIDGSNSRQNLVSVTGSYITVGGLEIKNSAGYCVNIQGSNNTFKDSSVHDCHDHGIYTDGKYESILNNIVYKATNVNSNFSMSSGWGSGIKVRVGGENILIEGNTVYNNYGEGIAATRGLNITIRKNKSYDNYGVNYYIDNSRNVVAEKNFAYCHPNSGFERSGYAATGFSLGEEVYSGTWGAQLSKVIIKNNLVVNCSRGVKYYGNDTGIARTDIEPSVIANNTFWGITRIAISFDYIGAETFQQGLLIANNIVQSSAGHITMTNPVGITIANNFWVGSTLPETTLRGTNYLNGDVKLVGPADYNPDNFRLQSTSPAIDRAMSLASVTDDYLGAVRPAGAGYDMGSYEYGASLTPSPAPSSSPGANKPGDLDNDGDVDIYDYNRVVSSFGNPYTIFDYNTVVSNFGH